MWSWVIRAVAWAAGNEAVRSMAVQAAGKVLKKREDIVEKKVEALAKAAGLTPDELRAAALEAYESAKAKAADKARRYPKIAGILLVSLATLPLFGAKGCTDCDKKLANMVIVCADDPDSAECKKAEKDYAESGCQPGTEPTPPPPPPDPCSVCPPETVTCVVNGAGEVSCILPQPPPPPPPPVPTPPNCAVTMCLPGYHCEDGVGCVKDPDPPQATSCPKKLAPGAFVFLRNNPYGQGHDSRPWVEGDPEFCFLIHGERVDRCHMEGWPKAVECEMELLGLYAGKAQACPVWEFRNASTGMAPQPCTDQSFDGPHMSCDHFGNTVDRDDPKTPGFEGQPAVCGEQRDQYGPIAGFFTVAHGKGEVRACRPDRDPSTCGPWRPVDK